MGYGVKIFGPGHLITSPDHLGVIMKLFLWLLQIVAEMVRNLVMASWLMYTVSRSWLGIFHMADVVSYKMFAMVVACKKEDGRETIVDQ